MVLVDGIAIAFPPGVMVMVVVVKEDQLEPEWEWEWDGMAWLLLPEEKHPGVTPGCFCLRRYFPLRRNA